MLSPFFDGGVIEEENGIELQETTGCNHWHLRKPHTTSRGSRTCLTCVLPRGEELDAQTAMRSLDCINN